MHGKQQENFMPVEMRQLGLKGTEMGGNEGRKTLRAEPQMQRPERTTVGPEEGALVGYCFG